MSSFTRSGPSDPSLAPCPDWESLLRGQDEVLAGEAPAGEGDDGDGVRFQEESWLKALEHQSHCDVCRETALVNDPTLVFQRLPEIELSAEEVETMRQRVTGVRRGRAIAEARDSAEAGSAVTVGSNSLNRWLGAAAILAAVSVGSMTVGWSPEVQAVGLTADDEAAIEASLGALPLVDGLGGYGVDQNVLLQGASGELDFAWVADGQLEP